MGKTFSSGTLEIQLLELIQQYAREYIKQNPLPEISSQYSYLEDLFTSSGGGASAGKIGPLSASDLKEILHGILFASRNASSPIKVAYLGPEFSYSHLAAMKYFGLGVQMVPVSQIAAVFHDVQNRHATYGIVPVDNSTHGRVTDALTEFLDAKVKICGMQKMAIHHVLASSGTMAEVKNVCSKPQALSQCRNWLSSHLPHVRITEAYSSAEAASLAKEKRDVAAVTSREAVMAYGLNILAEKIEDNPHNSTRFAILGMEDCSERTGKDCTTLMFQLPHTAGALADAMSVFKRHKLNLTWIESFPLPSAEDTILTYAFFITLNGHRQDLKVRRALAVLEKKTTSLTVLGSYMDDRR